MSEATTGAVGTVPAEGRGSWISELGPKEKRTLGACVGGWALDAMDVQLYSFVIPTLIATWGVTRAEAGALGWGAAALLYTLFFSLLPPETAWRALFFVGIAPAILVFFLRRYIEEPEVYRESQARIAETGDKPSFFEIFQPPLLRITFLGALMSTGAQGGYFAVTTWLPTFLRTERGLSVINSGGYLAVLIVGSFFGYLAGAYLADRIGRRATFLVFAIGAGVVVTTYTMVPFGDAAMLVLGFPLGFFASGVFSAMGAFFTEQFPTRVRGVGQGFAYNFGRAIGAVFPTLVGVMSSTMPLGQAIGLFAAAAYATMAVAAFLLPETKGKALTA